MQFPESAPESATGLKAALAGFLGAVVLTIAACSPELGVTVDPREETEPSGPSLSERLQDMAQYVSAEEISRTFNPQRREGVLQSRETLIDVLDRMGADRTQSNRAVHVAAKHVDMRRLLPGQKVVAFFDEDETSGLKLAGLTLRTGADKQVLASRTSSGDWVSRELAVDLKKTYARVGGEISTSIYQVARTQGAFDQQIIDFAKIFAYDIDFQREIREGDKFEIAYELFTDERGQPIMGGEVVYAEMNGRLAKRKFYRFKTPDDGIVDYYNEDGEAARKFLMKTPINGARLSSNFGRRKHPVLGYTKLHKGTDFAAPRGTPIYAAGNGVIERASRWSTYGNYVRIRHANGYKTAYAHLSRYGKGIKKGKRVRQGDIIGYVGTTGRSTGPHLHYEVIVNGKHVNVMRLDLPTGRKLGGKVLDAFNEEKARIDAARSVLPALPGIEPLEREHAAATADKPA